MSTLDAKIRALDELMWRRLCNKCLDALRTSAMPLCTIDMAARLRLPWVMAQGVMTELAELGAIATVGRTSNGLTTYRVASVGACDWCGLVDHHLVNGECAECAVRVQKEKSR